MILFLLFSSKHTQTFVCVQELANPTVDAPGKGYIGKHGAKVSSANLKK